MASNISLPENRVAWFVKGKSLGLVSTYSTSGTTRTDRKRWQAVDHAVSDGLLLHYWSDPKKIAALTETPDIDNAFHLALVDYIKMCLYMDRAGSTSGEMSAVSLQLSQMHRAKFEESVRRFGNRRREKVGGVRSILPYNFQ
jgi:predicted DNA-binding protein (MmcQ/YjbR family)